MRGKQLKVGVKLIMALSELPIPGFTTWCLVIGFAITPVHAAHPADMKQGRHSEFKIPPSDSTKYRVAFLDDILFLKFASSAIINQEGALRARALPSQAFIRVGGSHIPAYTKPGPHKFCKETVADDTYHDYPDIGSPFFERAMLVRSENRAKYNYFVAVDRSWVARCFAERKTCITFYTNGKWTARLNIFESDLCNVSTMYRRLSSIIDHWVR